MFRTFTSILPDLSVSGANRPTITLVPGDNGETIQRFLTPVPIETLLFLSGDELAGRGHLAVVGRAAQRCAQRRDGQRTIAGGHLGLSAVPKGRGAHSIAQDHEMASIRSELRDTPLSGPIPAGSVTAATVVEAAKAGMEYRPSDDGPTWALVRKQNKMMIRVNPEAIDRPEMEEMTRLLNLRPGQLYYDVVVAPGTVPDPLLYPRPPSAELRITPRSTSQVFFYLSNGVEVPSEHVECGLVKPTSDAEGRPMDGGN